jgi:hypothetical protein
VKLTAQEEEYTRRVGEQIGREPEDLIREGEQLKSEAFSAHQAQAAGWTERSRAAPAGLGMTAGRYQDPTADPEVMAAERAHRHRQAQPRRTGGRVVRWPGQAKAPTAECRQPVDWAALAEPITRTRPWRSAVPWPELDWAGRGFTRPGPEPEREAGE